MCLMGPGSFYLFIKNKKQNTKIRKGLFDKYSSMTKNYQ